MIPTCITTSPEPPDPRDPQAVSDPTVSAWLTSVVCDLISGIHKCSLRWGAGWPADYFLIRSENKLMHNGFFFFFCKEEARVKKQHQSAKGRPPHIPRQRSRLSCNCPHILSTWAKQVVHPWLTFFSHMLCSLLTHIYSITDSFCHL